MLKQRGLRRLGCLATTTEAAGRFLKMRRGALFCLIAARVSLRVASVVVEEDCAAKPVHAQPKRQLPATA